MEAPKVGGVTPEPQDGGADDLIVLAARFPTSNQVLADDPEVVEGDVTVTSDECRGSKRTMTRPSLDQTPMPDRIPARPDRRRGSTNPLHELRALGQSVWYDNIRRALIESGELEAYLDEFAITGVTSNPSIFERAISGSDDYDEALDEAVARGLDDPEELFWEIAVKDIQDAADLLRPIHQDTGKSDGFVSLELPPRLSMDAQGSVEMAKRLHARIGRPNAMIKVPATAEGIVAIEELIHLGVPVNVTLIFSPGQWEAVADAYERGVERRLADGFDPFVPSVASVFVSRMDVKANKLVPEELRNQVGVANARAMYAAWRDRAASPRWEGRVQRGARPQRLLWASTSAKDPSLPDTYYLDELAAAGTVTTVPDETLRAFARSGTATPFPADGTAAREILNSAAHAGVDLEILGEELLGEGNRKFAEAFDRLLECIGEKAARLRSGRVGSSRRILTGPIDAASSAVLDELRERSAVRRTWNRDHTLWQDDPAEVTDRLGWLSLPDKAEGWIPRLMDVRAKAVADEFTHVLVVGMGGSSLFPLVMSGVAGASADGLHLDVLDSVDPDAIRRIEHAVPMDSTLIVASSKSGTTMETRSLLEYFWAQSNDPTRFIAITDPDTPLAELARERGFRQLFQADPNVGGRYSALTEFGLVPAAMAGVDVAALVRKAGSMAAACATCVPSDSNPGLRLASLLAGAVRVGRDKLTLVVEPEYAPFGLWIEQLVAESTGKAGTGLIPIVDEPLGEPAAYGDDRIFVRLGGRDGGRALERLADAGHPVAEFDLNETADLGAEVFRWEFATALVGAALSLNPFDQPNVEAAKSAARKALESSRPEVPAERALDEILEGVAPGDYIAIQAYVDPEAEVVQKLQEARLALRDRYRVATTLGVGPRYLHSTGQLHKGGPASGVFLQVVSDAGSDPAIPGEPFGFDTLKRAQAAGDLQALHDAGRRGGRISINDLLKVTR